MKKFIVHAGTHKTGSTSLQVFMVQAQALLAEQGVLYPQAGRPQREGVVSCGHHVLAWYLRGKWGVTTDEAWRALRAEVEAWTGDRVVVSAEDFQSLSAEQVAAVQSYVPGCEVHVVMYVRNPLDYMLSSYKQRVKMGTWAAPLRVYVEEFGGRINYLDLVERWASGLGQDRVHVRLFDRVKRDPGLEADFCRVIGVDFEPLRGFVDKPANVSPPDHQIERMRRLNRLTWWAGDMQRRRGWPARLRAQVRRSGARGALVRAVTGIGLPDALVSHAEIDRLRDLVSDWLEPFLVRYVAPEDRDLLRF